MAINWIVMGITVLMTVLVLIWIGIPEVRTLFEAPKYRVLSWDRVATEAARKEGSPLNEKAIPGENPFA